MSKKFNFDLKKIKKEYIFIAILVIIAVVFVVNTFKGVSKKQSTETQSVNATEQYVNGLENKLVSAISSVKGVGGVSVKITATGSYKNVYLTEREEVRENQSVTVIEKPVIIGGKTFIVQEELPKICGVVVVAGGSENIGVKANILNLCVTLLGVESNQVVILNGKK